MRKLYIAYGSNMDEKQMARRCPTARLSGTAKLEGYRLLFKGSKTGAYATIEAQKGGRVPVLIWEIGEQDERNLDCYEGYPVFYHKKEIEVQLGGERKNAMVYIMDESRELGEPSAGYHNVLENAYWKFGFPMGILMEAHEASRMEVQNGNCD